jgi:MFS family permease
MTQTLVRRVRQRLSGTDDAFDRRLIAPLVLGAILNPVNSSIIAVSLVPIGAAFGAPPAQTAWLVSSLYLATSIGQPVAGRLVDVYGPRPLFLTGAALTGAAGVLGTLAPNLPVLVAARVILGFGTCAGYPAAMSLIRRESQRTGQDSPGTVLTILAVSSQTIAVIGPPLGGVLIAIGGWRTTLGVNIPLALIGFVLGMRRMPRSDIYGTSAARRLDFVGIGMFAATLVAVLLFLMSPHIDRLWLPGIAAVFLAGFAWRELHCADPFIELRMLAGNVPLVLSYTRAVLISVVNYCFLYGFTQWLEDGRGLSATHAGLVLLPMFVIAIAVSTTTGRRREIRAKLIVGQSVQVGVCALLLVVSSNSAIWLVLLVTVVLGVPQGLNNLAVQNAVYYQADPARIGASAGLLRTFLYLGAIGASAATGGLFGRSADTGGLHHLAVFMVAVSAAGLAMTILDHSLSRVVVTTTTAEE